MGAAARPGAGVTVVYCDGHRCRALRRPGMPGQESAGLAEILRRAVRASRGAVLVRSGCLGACERAPAVLVLDGTGRAARRGVLVGPVADAREVDVVVDLVRRADAATDGGSEAPRGDRS
ncbi:hypothetical protein COO58_08145 [Micromonospora sp. WMMA1996]|uniref:(2Fe-2S) ferredoxin domain-containing protein n=1 Tax=Micromonospora sp. WMMA1996 TaxID=2039878 RepID=UPI000BF91924|nr:(2Fe-2S) ferredoxin domain-containing protein [Micromonospora sp. WMMA1996]PGH44401.1 hypothetical protein COO58_08145 [Micromonospora sp. WMMA1996]